MLRALMAMFWISRSHLTANTLPLVVLTTLLFGMPKTCSWVEECHHISVKGLAGDPCREGHSLT